MVQAVEVTDTALLAQLEGQGAGEGAGTKPATASGEVFDPAVLSQLEGNSSAPATETSAVPFAIDKFKSGVAGFLGTAAMLGDVAMLPVEIPSAFGVKSIGGMKLPEPLAAYKASVRGWEAILGVKKVEAPKDLYGHESKTNEYLGSIMEFAGGSLLGGATVVSAAARKLATAVVTALGTVSGGTFAVEGKELGGNLAPSLGLTKEQGQQIGQMVGSMAGPTLIAKGAQKVLEITNAGESAAKNAGLTDRSPEAQKAAANKMLRKEIADAVTFAPHSAENVARAITLMGKNEKFSPTKAQATDAPGLIAMARETANKSPEALAKAAAADRRNLEAIASYKEEKFGKSVRPDVEMPIGGKPTFALTDPAKIKLASDHSLIDLTLDANARKLRELSQQFHRRIDNEAVGTELRAKYWSAREVAQQANKQELGRVYATAKKFGIAEDMTDIRDGVMKLVTADKTTFQSMPPTFSKILNEYPQGTPAASRRVQVQKPGQKIPSYRTETTPATEGKSIASFEELHSLYKQANKDWADATISGDSTKAFYMKTIRDQLQQKVQKYNDPKYGELASKFQKFNLNYSKYAQTFKEGAGGEIAKRTKGGLATDAEDIVGKIVLGAGDKKRGVQDFFELFGGDPRAAELLHDGLLDNLSKAAVKDGVFDPKAAQRWLDSHHTAMGELPETAKLFSDAQKTGASLVNRQLELQQQRKVLDRSVLAKVAQNEQPEKLINAAISNPPVMRAVMEGAYTLESKQAIARAIADNISKRPDGYEFLQANKEALKPVMDKLGKDHWQNLNDIAEMEKISKRVQAPTAVELRKIQDIGEQVIGTSVKGMFSRLRNLDKPMGVSKSYLVLDVGGRWLYKVRSEELARLRESAMWDAQTAETLARLSKKDTYSKRDLLDLQKISFNGGVVSTMEAAKVAAEGPGAPVGEEERKRRAAEGVGKWKRGTVQPF